MPTDQRPEENVPAVVCTACHAPVYILLPVDELPDNFEASCAKCGDISEYQTGEIKMLPPVRE